MESNPLISIIIPAYNAEDTLKRCLSSIQNQTYPNIEIIVVDDGSSDGTLSILKDTAAEDSRLHFFSKENGGVSSARNYGLSKAKGEYVVFVDADDYISDCFASKIAQHSGEEWIVFPTYSLPEKKRKIEKNELKSILGEILYRDNEEYKYYTFSSPWSKAYKTSILRENNLFFDEVLRIGEDAVFNLYYIEHIQGMLCHDEIVYSYCEYLQSATKKFQAKRLDIDYNYQISVNQYIEKYQHFDLNNKQCLLALNGLWRCMCDYFMHPQNNETWLSSYKRLKGFINKREYFAFYENNRELVKKKFGWKKYILFEICYQKTGIVALNTLLRLAALIRRALRYI